jgi:hypothetical protein
VSREREELKGRLEGTVKRCAHAEQLLRVAHIEKDDLLADYKAVCDKMKR